MFELFKEKASALMAEVHAFKNRKDALEFVKNFIRENTMPEDQKAVVWYDTWFLDGVKKEDLLAEIPQISFEITPEIASKAKIGINEVDGAIAESGSLIEVSNRIQKRLVSALPEIHIAILPKSKILPDLKTALRSFHLHTHPHITLISGPSRTADIERVLTIGVHGPERVIIVCIENL
ncbi:lactate utilization protein [Thermodesulfobacterium sp. TA1]|uniref:LutC/YkgG family protein n=1 Tax=Thermodesulfobacterium sp. TA1 TaxID=2234087 RepID=UPI001232C095|nr:lactate utilization protein [Thermodesulfobacterium sp. TA1]QER42748.1 lactate utilization protein [Thermodesulfobacterium sp. TA1]